MTIVRFGSISPDSGSNRLQRSITMQVSAADTTEATTRHRTADPKTPQPHPDREGGEQETLKAGVQERAWKLSPRVGCSDGR
jgi:hypothetical protein